MGDTDFPTVLGNRMASNPAGYLQQYVKGMKEYKQTGTNIVFLQNRRGKGPEWFAVFKF